MSKNDKRMRSSFPSMAMVLMGSVLVSLGCKAQETEPSTWKVKYGLISTGGMSYPDNQIDFQDLNELAPNSELLQLDFTGFNEDRFNYGSSTRLLNASIELRKMSGNAINDGPKVRVGLLYQAMELFSYGLNKTDSYIIDTLVSTSTGEEFYVDSTSYSSLNSYYSTERIMLNADIVYSTDEDRRFSLYGGIGLAGGISFNNWTEVNYSVQPEYIGPNDFQFPEFENERFKNSSAFLGSIYIPLGFNWRLSDKKPLWDKLALFMEFRPSLNYTDIPEMEAIVSSDLMTLFGLRVDLK